MSQGTARWSSGWTMSRWQSRKFAPPKCTPRQSSKEKKTTFRRGHLRYLIGDDNLLQSLCKNLERAESKKWLNETLEILMKVTNSLLKYIMRC